MTVGQVAEPNVSIRGGWISNLALMLAGATAAGACIGLNRGPEMILGCAGGLVAVVVGSILLLMPALYIAMAFVGKTLTASTFVLLTRRAAGQLGRVLLGFTPALLFLIATSTDGRVRGFAGPLIIGLSAVLAVRVLYNDLALRADAQIGPCLAFWGWAAVGLAAGFGLFQSVVMN